MWRGGGQNIRYGMSIETREIKLFGGISQGCPDKKYVFHSRPLFLGRRISSRILSGFFSSSLWEKVPRKILQENPRQNPPKFIQQKSPTHFCRRAGPTDYVIQVTNCMIISCCDWRRCNSIPLSEPFSGIEDQLYKNNKGIVVIPTFWGGWSSQSERNIRKEGKSCCLHPPPVNDSIQSRKCAINNFWTKNLRGLLGWGSRGSRQIIYVRIFPNIWSVFGPKLLRFMALFPSLSIAPSESGGWWQFLRTMLWCSIGFSVCLSCHVLFLWMSFLSLCFAKSMVCNMVASWNNGSHENDKDFQTATNTGIKCCIRRFQKGVGGMWLATNSTQNTAKFVRRKKAYLWYGKDSLRQPPLSANPFSKPLKLAEI